MVIAVLSILGRTHVQEHSIRGSRPRHCRLEMPTISSHVQVHARITRSHLTQTGHQVRIREGQRFVMLRAIRPKEPDLGSIRVGPEDGMPRPVLPSIEQQQIDLFKTRSPLFIASSHMNWRLKSNRASPACVGQTCIGRIFG